MAADFSTDNLPINETSYSQQDVQFFRKKIMADIARGFLKYPLY